MPHQYETCANYLKSKTAYRPEVGIICGSGLSGLSKSLENSETFDYADIPGFPEATVPGHTGELVFGTIGSTQCVCMRGRFHFYEGNSMDQVVLPVRVMRLMGVKLLIVTNAAGGLNPGFNVGDIMIIQDHFGVVSGIIYREKMCMLIHLTIYKPFYTYTMTYHCSLKNDIKYLMSCPLLYLTSHHIMSYYLLPIPASSEWKPASERPE